MRTRRQDARGAQAPLRAGRSCPYYGADIRDRIRSAGFQLEEFTAEGEECDLCSAAWREGVHCAAPALTWSVPTRLLLLGTRYSRDRLMVQIRIAEREPG